MEFMNSSRRGKLQTCESVYGRMKYIKNTLDFYVGEPTVISLGKFDGIHRGHEL